MTKRFFNLILPIVGFGLVGANVSLISNLATLHESGTLLVSPTFYFTVGSVGAAILIVAERKRLSRLSDHLPTMTGLTILGVAAAVVLLLVRNQTTPGAGFAFCLALLVLGGIHAYLTCAWLELYTQMLPKDAAVSICFSHLVLAIAGFLFVWLCVEQEAKITTTLVLLCLNMVMYNGSVSFFSKSDTTGEKVSADWGFPTKPVLLVAIFAFASVIGRTGIEAATSNYPRWAVVIVCLCAAAYLMLKYEHVELRLFAVLALLFALTGLLLRFSSGDVMMLVSAFFTNAAYALFYIFVYISLCRMSYRYGTSPLLLFGTTYAAIRAAYWLGGVCGAQAYATSNQAFLYVGSLTMIALVAVFLLCMRSPTALETWGIEPGKGQAERSLAAMNVIKQDRDARIARKYSLTHREEEIMSLLADGDSLVQIEKRLFISHATVKTHAQHIYVKMGVHSQKELKELVAGFRMD